MVALHRRCYTDNNLKNTNELVAINQHRTAGEYFYSFFSEATADF
jgi:hypothetical protein